MAAEVCHVTFGEGRNCSPYTEADASKVVWDTWDWQTSVCKFQDLNPDMCLWQGCLADGNLTLGSEYYLKTKVLQLGGSGKRPIEAAYCCAEHCGNTRFTLS